MAQVDFNELLGKVIKRIEISSDNESIYFYLTNGAEYKQYHEQDCCESVSIEDINGDLNDLIGYRITQAEESTSDATNSRPSVESATWTFYKLATVKGFVTIRWFGESNGYYSEYAGMYKVKEEDPIREIRKKKLEEIKKK